ncbi:MAG: hypothetical protein ABRQ25_00015 [Clostridiaceae bacterium]
MNKLRRIFRVILCLAIIFRIAATIYNHVMLKVETGKIVANGTMVGVN